MTDYPPPASAPRRIYFDNAATSFPKPRAVTEALTDYFTRLGASPGRGSYAETVEAGRLINETRRTLNRLINGQSADHVVFTLNCSDALNLAIKGVLGGLTVGGGSVPHAICTDIDHNSILRPLNAMADRGEITLTRVPVDGKTGLVDPAVIRRAVTPATRLIAITHVSNVLGVIQPIGIIGRMARELAIPFVVDAAQSAGHLPVDVQADCIDLLAAPGHKSLMGPLGTGFLYLRPGMEKIVRPLREGGTGSVSELDRQPEFMPDRYEPGSHNAPGIIALGAGVLWVEEQTVQRLRERDLDLVRTFIEGVSNIDGLTYFGPQGVRDRVGVFSVRIEGYSPSELSTVLESGYGILTRSGLHCAPHAHGTIGTTKGGGTTRFSFGPFLTKQDVKFATDALAEVADMARSQR
jgi:cysteine desulfurase / selenocysteine lyase